MIYIEKPKIKLKRFTLFAFLAVIIAILALPIGTSFSQELSGHGTTELYASQAAYAAAGQKNGTINALPFSELNGTASISNSYITGSANNTTLYANYAIDYIISNVSFNQLNEHSVNAFDAFVSPVSNLTAILGFGTYSNSVNGTSLKFTPLLSDNFTGKNSTTHVSFSLNPAELTENGTDVLILEIQGLNSSASFSFSGHVIGTSQSQPWYLAGESVAYALGGTMLFAFGFLALPHFDINISKTKLPTFSRKPTTSKKGPSKQAKNTMNKAKRIDNKGGRK